MENNTGKLSYNVVPPVLYFETCERKILKILMEINTQN